MVSATMLSTHHGELQAPHSTVLLPRTMLMGMDLHVVDGSLLMSQVP